MRNIFIFIRRYFNFLFFIILQIVCIVFLVNYSGTYQAVYGNIANEVTGVTNTQYNKVQNFFHLRENNRLLLEENTQLKNMLGLNFDTPDTLKRIVLDSLYRDTTGKMRKFIWLPAKVVNNSVSMQYNYLTLHRGEDQGVRKDMAVIGPKGIVGTVIDVSPNFSKVMSLLHRNTKVSSMLKKSEVIGIVGWDGKDPGYLTLEKIPKTTKVTKGDTVVTSRYSSNFPPYMLVGFVEQIEKDPGTNYFIIKLKTATNFYTVEYVNLVENMQWTEQKTLEQAAVKSQ